jgi:hypothetical protein
MNLKEREWQDVVKGKIAPALAMKAYRGSGVTSPFILNLGTWCR